MTAMTRQVQTIYCDDIRHEISGKISFIGSYSSAMVASKFPLEVPKLCLAMRVITPSAQPFRKLAFRVLKDAEIMAEGQLSDDDLSNLSENGEQGETADIADRVQVFNFMLQFVSLSIDAPCVIRVRVQTESEELRGLGLSVRSREEVGQVQLGGG